MRLIPGLGCLKSNIPTKNIYDGSIVVSGVAPNAATLNIVSGIRHIIPIQQGEDNKGDTGTLTFTQETKIVGPV